MKESISKVLFKAIKETLEEYLNKTSLNGCYLLHFIRRRKYQRLVWSMFLAMAVSFAIYVCTTILNSFLDEPTVTTLDSQTYTIYEAPFPAIAVCSHNKFSRQAMENFILNVYVDQFVKTLHSKDNQDLKYWEERLEMLSGLYNYDSLDFQESEILHLELESILGEKLNTSKILNMLAPSCEDLLLKCFWAGKVINCKEQFELKIFIDGPCCVFNYQYMKDLNSVYYPIYTGPRKGLAFIVNSTTNDYYYAEESTIGFNVKVFSTQFIPDSRLGSVEEFNVGPAENVDVQLKLISQVAAEDTRIYSVHQRRCYFPYEHEQSTFDKSECILKCKLEIIERDCECLPFYAVKSDFEFKGAENATECSLVHLGCLAFYKYELLDSTDCTDCYPLCSYNYYWYRKTVNCLNHTLWLHNSKMYLNDTMNLAADISLVKIYYESEIATKYNKNVLYKWHHILSNIGGVMGICMGCSIINGIEIVYFCCYRLVEKFLKLWKAQI